VTDGAADPSVVWNSQEKAWYIFYTQRRANMDLPANENWTMGTKVGIAKSADQGRSWSYIGTAQGLSRGLKEETFWAPHVFENEGTYHLFVTFKFHRMLRAEIRSPFHRPLVRHKIHQMLRGRPVRPPRNAS